MSRQTGVTKIIFLMIKTEQKKSRQWIPNGVYLPPFSVTFIKRIPLDNPNRMCLIMKTDFVLHNLL